MTAIVLVTCATKGEAEEAIDATNGAEGATETRTWTFNS